jgi:deazaflavin-dependent oxidoreductase (nitroreductase family)
MSLDREFRAPTATERVFNRLFGFLVGLGLGSSHNYLLEVRGRKSGKLYSNPVNVLELQTKRYLVAPRGRTQWVRNAEASEQVTLRRGRQRSSYRLRAIGEAEKLAVLKAYLDRFRREVQRYFPVPADSPPEAFTSVAEQFPAFELTALP